ncbi:hypothetical protein OKIT_0966 [Oenococcus kitaharae DSM 17330]|uniref:Uncharacterized protein n=1 Tax=Oenococcus kitaharae DSM 17330 TaxID=1045004 RepID=G9WJM4_9LACO|nr:hypothetical protein OKIT_0966 [Oenococcus kitaharae DSM 17330]OEY83712.1 hypothetical protein NT96_05395 [Oenococcus kitaharae]OEY83884.1 hypothetical protein NT95_03235 [Oenococcus kitaharae]OEY84161.1 hypothetical protein NV75_04695 [Oenococcus kitaharae]
MIGFADGSTASCPDLAAAVSGALKDCPLLTARYTSPEAKNTFKLALSSKDIQAKIVLKGIEKMTNRRSHFYNMKINNP